MADIGTTYRGQRSRPGDAAAEQEKAARIEELRFAQRQQASKDDAEKDLAAPFNDAVNERLTALGGQALDPGAMDAGIMAVKQRAEAAVAESQLTKEQKLGRAVADALIERGVIPATDASPDVDDLIAADPDEAEDFIDENGDIWQLDGDGAWTRAGADTEEDPPDEWPNYLPGNEGFVDLTGDDAEDGDLDAAA